MGMTLKDWTPQPGDAVRHSWFGVGVVVCTEYHSGAPTPVRVDFGPTSYGLQWVSPRVLQRSA